MIIPSSHKVKEGELEDKVILVTGPNPTGIAAAILYLMCENTLSFVTQKQLADVTLMNPQTISNSVRLLRRVLKKYKIKIS